MKYLIAQRRNDTATPFLFCSPTTHADMASMLRVDGYAVLSAGFVRFGPAGAVTTHDRSTSLNLEPRAEDAALIAAFYAVTLSSIGLQA